MFGRSSRKNKLSRDSSCESILNNIDLNISVIEIDIDGRIISINKNFSKLMNYEMGDLVGRHYHTLLNPTYSQSQMYAELWRNITSVTATKAEIRCINREDVDVYFDATFSPVFDDAGCFIKIIKVGLDVTTQKLRQNIQEGKLSAISRSQAVIEFDLNGIIRAANANFLNIMQYSSDEIVGRHHRIFVTQREQASPEYNLFWQRLAAGEFISAKFTRLAKSGKEIVIQASYNPIFGDNGKPVSVVKFATDITELAAKDADNHGKIEAISKAQAVVEFDLDGTILTANDNFLKIMGYSIEEVRGQHHKMFVNKEVAQSDGYRLFWQQLGKGIYTSGEFHRLAKGGRPVYLQASYNAILDSDGQPYKIVKLASDVTTRRFALNRTSELSHSLQDLSAAVEQMAVTGRAIADTMARTKAAADEAARCVSDADESARGLSVMASQMDGITDLIGNITSQINLLALNATIEAARAGDAGRGFAVVATEVKNLAIQARKATEQISLEIAGVRTSSAAVVSSLNTIRDSVRSVQEQVMFTVSAVEEQSATSQDMARSMQVASSEADNIVKAA